mgnify:CR=1 FL=1
MKEDRIRIPENKSVNLPVLSYSQSDTSTTNFDTLMRDDEILHAMIGSLIEGLPAGFGKGVSNYINTASKRMRYIGNYKSEDTKENDSIRKLKRNRFNSLKKEKFEDVINHKDLPDDLKNKLELDKLFKSGTLYNYLFTDVLIDKKTERRISAFDPTVEQICNPELITSRFGDIGIPLEGSEYEYEEGTKKEREKLKITISRDVENFVKAMQENKALIYPEMLKRSITVEKDEESVEIVFDTHKYIQLVFKKIFPDMNFKDLSTNKALQNRFKEIYNMKVLDKKSISTSKVEKLLADSSFNLLEVESETVEGKVDLDNLKLINNIEKTAPKPISLEKLKLDPSKEINVSNVNDVINSIDKETLIGNVLTSLITPTDSILTTGKFSFFIDINSEFQELDSIDKFTTFLSKDEILENIEGEMFDILVLVVIAGNYVDILRKTSEKFEGETLESQSRELEQFYNEDERVRTFLNENSEELEQLKQKAVESQKDDEKLSVKEIEERVEREYIDDAVREKKKLSDGLPIILVGETKAGRKSFERTLRELGQEISSGKVFQKKTYERYFELVDKEIENFDRESIEYQVLDNLLSTFYDLTKKDSAIFTSANQVYDSEVLDEMLRYVNEFSVEGMDEGRLNNLRKAFTSEFKSDKKGKLDEQTEKAILWYNSLTEDDKEKLEESTRKKITSRNVAEVHLENKDKKINIKRGLAYFRRAGKGEVKNPKTQEVEIKRRKEFGTDFSNSISLDAKTIQSVPSKRPFDKGKITIGSKKITKRDSQVLLRLSRNYDRLERYVNK